MDRFAFQYFLVEFHGKGWQMGLQDKTFVYKGCEVERLGQFMATMKTRFPGSEIIRSEEAPSGGKGQCMLRLV